jgi:hypothetical protein
MKYNLLQKAYDLQCEMFISGFIDLDTFLKLEEKYVLQYQLFIINLN